MVVKVNNNDNNYNDLIHLITLILNSKLDSETFIKSLQFVKCAV